MTWGCCGWHVQLLARSAIAGAYRWKPPTWAWAVRPTPPISPPAATGRASGHSNQLGDAPSTHRKEGLSFGLLSQQRVTGLRLPPPDRRALGTPTPVARLVPWRTLQDRTPTGCPSPGKGGRRPQTARRECTTHRTGTTSCSCSDPWGLSNQAAPSGLSLPSSSPSPAYHQPGSPAVLGGCDFGV